MTATLAADPADPHVDGMYVCERCHNRNRPMLVDNYRRCTKCGSEFVRKLRQSDIAADAHAPFVATIIERHYADFRAGRPLDDGPHLVFADWLEEQGDPRGEFIRVQCELAKMPQGPIKTANGMDIIYPGWSALRACEAELLTRHGAEWARETFRDTRPDAMDRWLGGGRKAPLWSATDARKPNGEVIGSWTWHRGFPSILTLSARQAWGEACGPCQGTGKLRAYLALGAPLIKCGTCHGTGRVGAILPAIVRCVPVESVRVSDKEPYESNGRNRGFWWHKGIDPALPHCLPDDILDALEGSILHMGRGIDLGRCWATPALAHASLGRAVIRHALARD